MERVGDEGVFRVKQTKGAEFLFHVKRSLKADVLKCAVVSRETKKEFRAKKAPCSRCFT